MAASPSTDLVRHLKPAPIGIAVVDEDGVDAGDARPALDGRHDRIPVADLGAPGDAADEFRADDALVHEVLPLLELALGRPLRHARARASAAGRAVDGLVAVEHGVAAGGAGAQCLARPHDVREAGDLGLLRVLELVLGAERLAYPRAP